MLFIFLGWYIYFFNSDIFLNKDGSLRIEENITVNFDDGYYHGIYREIPLELKGNIGNYSLGFRVLEVLMDGEKIPVKKSTISYSGWQHLKLRIGDPEKTITGFHTYTIIYTVILGARYFNEHDELYWNITGNRWESKMDSVNFNVFFPEPVELSKDDIRIYHGSYGATETIQNYYLSSTSLSNSYSNLLAGEGITIAIRFPKGYLNKPSLMTVIFLKIRNNLPWLLPIIIFFFLFNRWIKKGKDLPVGPVMTRYEPPSDIKPAEAGTLFDQKVDNADIVSILFDLAQKGYIKIEEIESTKILLFKSKDYKITLLKEPDNELPQYYKKFYEGLKTVGGKSFMMSDLQGSIYSTVSLVRTQIYSETAKKSLFYSNPERVRMSYFVIGFLLFFFGIFSFAINPKLAFSLLLSGILSFIFGPAMPKRTPHGNKKLSEILGFREFLSRVEKDKLLRMLEEKPFIFFDYIPYAISLGVLDRWAERFKGIDMQSPNWFVLTGYSGKMAVEHFATSFNNSLNNFSSYMSPPKGSSSGLSGGSSGGGGGGGGGGAW